VGSNLLAQRQLTARLAVQDRDEHVPGHDRAVRQAGAADRPRRRRRTRQAPGRPLIETVWVEPCDGASLGLSESQRLS